MAQGNLFPMFAVLTLLFGASCSPSTAASVPFDDGFDRPELGGNWVDLEGGEWHIKDGRLHNTGAQNKPLWLSAGLPDNVVIEFDIWSDPKICDCKFEVFGDGRTHASGYILIMGGWKNRISTIARLDEHEKERPEKKSECVPGKKMRWKVERRGGQIKWYVDDKLHMERNDPKPLKGKGHDRLAFSNWQSDVYYDNLSIRVLR